jgi:PAS domain S-box-containing protein
MVECLEHNLISSRSGMSHAACHDCDQVTELYLRVMVDSYQSAVAVLDETGTILYVNRSWREFSVELGCRADFYGVGRNYLEVRRLASDALAEESAALAKGVDQVLLGRETEFQGEYFSHNPIAGRWIRVHAVRFDLPRAVRVLVTHEDITESRQTVEARHKEAERLQLLLEVTHVLPWEADFATAQFTYVGGRAVELLGYPISDWYQSDFWPAHLHPEDRELVMSRCNEYINGRDNYELEYRMIAKDGRVVWLNNLVSVIRENGQPKTIRGFSVDVTESKQNEAALRDLSRRLINAQEEERRRVARELHDDLNQRMALLSIELEQLSRKRSPEDLDRRLQSLQTQAREISADIHRLSYELHPSKLDHLGLAPAIKSLCQEISTKGKLEVELQQDGFPAHLPSSVTLCVFRIAQESLRNCVKHSGANKARVTLEKTGQEIRLSVSDNGRGFEMDSAAMQKGLGFTSMRERLRIVGGEMQVQSQPRHGTVIDVSVPLVHAVETVRLLGSRTNERARWSQPPQRSEDKSRAL